MATAEAPWFVVERSEALAALLLTRHEDVEVATRNDREDGIDLLVGVDGRGSALKRLFVVQVKGTLSADPADWMRNVKQLFRHGAGQLYLPTCVFVVNVRDNSARYAWMAEPFAEPDRGTLKIHHAPKFIELDDAAVSAIVLQVKAYYDAMLKQQS